MNTSASRAILIAIFGCAPIPLAACGDPLAPDSPDSATPWTAPEKVDDSASAGELAESGKGAVAAWVRTDGNVTSVRARRYAAMAGGSEPFSLTLAPGSRVVAGFRFALDGGGNGLAAWLERDETESRLVASRLPAGAGWEVPQVVDRVAAGVGFGMDLAVEPGGDALLAWSGPAHVRAFHWSGGAWSGPVTSASGEFPSSVQVALDGQAGLVCWTERAGQSNRAVARYLDLTTGDGAEASMLLSRHGSGGRLAIVAPDRSAAVIQDGPMPGHARALRYERGVGWGAPVSLPMRDVHDVAADARGQLIALASGPEERAPSDSLVLIDWTPGVGWGLAEMVMGGAMGTGVASTWAEAAMRVDAVTGTMSVLGRREPDQLWLARSRGGNWRDEKVPGHTAGSEPTRCARTSACFSSPRLAVSSRTTWVLWRQQDDLDRSSLWLQRRHELD